MSSIRALTAEKMQSIQDEMVVDASISSGKLLLTKDNGSVVDAGQVVGSDGPSDLDSVVWLTADFTNSEGTGGVPTATMWSAPAFESSTVTCSPNAVRRFTTDVFINYIDVDDQPFIRLELSGQDRCVFLESGIVYVSYFISYNSGASGRRIVIINKNDIEVGRSVVAADATYSAVSAEYYGYFQAGDYLTFNLYQDTGAILNYAYTGAKLAIVWMPVYS